MMKLIIYLTQVIYDLFSFPPFALSVFVFKNVSKGCFIFNYILRYILFRLRSIKHSGRTGKKQIIFSYEKIGIIFIAFFLSISNITCPFSYDSAMYAAQKGDIQSADEKMRKVVANAPDRADVLYDAGVLAHELKNFSQAVAYFTRAADQADRDKDMQVRSYFNAGNASVAANDLHKALEFYDKALKIAPNDEYACHNRERVAQMLQEQENKQNQQQEDKKNQQDDEQKEDQNQSEQKNTDDQNHSKNDQQKSDSSQNQSQPQDESKSSDGKAHDGSQKQPQKTNQGKDAEQGNTGKDGKQQGNKANKQNDGANKQKRDGDEEFDAQSQKTGDQGKKQKSEKHEKSPGKKSKSGDRDSIASHGEQAQSSEMREQKEGNGGKPVDAWLDTILSQQESHDKAMNKKLMEMRIREHGGKNAQNNW